jgi:hypothetical protein
LLYGWWLPFRGPGDLANGGCRAGEMSPGQLIERIPIRQRFRQHMDEVNAPVCREPHVRGTPGRTSGTG